MKRFCSVLFLFIFCIFWAAAETGDQGEEVDFLLFAPNSGGQFVNDAQANTQLDNLAKYLLGKNLSPGKIHVYGYAAVAKNNIEPVNLSRERALFVITALEKRGVGKDLFSEPVGHGEVNLWGNNASEADKIPNRRVRIMVDNTLLTPAIITPVDSGNKTITAEKAPEAPVTAEVPAEKPGSKFPWAILLPLLLIIAAILFLAFRKKKKPVLQIVQGTPAAEIAPKTPPLAPPPPVIPPAEPVKPAVVQAAPPVKEETPAPVTVSYTVVDLEEEIRRRAYELFLQRNCQHGYAEKDWHMAVQEVCAKYEADGYSTNMVDGCWHATKSFKH